MFLRSGEGVAALGREGVRKGREGSPEGLGLHSEEGGPVCPEQQPTPQLHRPLSPQSKQATLTFLSSLLLSSTLPS